MNMFISTLKAEAPYFSKTLVSISKSYRKNFIFHWTFFPIISSAEMNVTFCIEICVIVYVEVTRN
jgi:hypothetical protein